MTSADCPPNTTWHELIAEEAVRCGDDMSGFQYTTGAATNLDTRFYSGYGSSKGCPFTAWTDARVYFPVVYDGSEWAGSVPRHPCNEATKHQGGQ